MQNFNDHFPQDPSICYLNHAAVSPWPKCTAQAVSEFAQENLVYGATHYPKWMTVEQQLRERLARLLNIDHTDEIALAKSTSEALSIIAYGLDWQAGDEVIITNQEFPSNRIVWESLSQFGVRLVIADISIQPPLDAIQGCISKRTRLVSVSSVQYASGILTDLYALSKLCQQHSILLCIDAIQSLGALPFDQSMIQADFVVADGHKWLMAAEGLALLYIKHELLRKLRLFQFGWHMVKHRGDYDRAEWTSADNATRFECGSPNMLGIHALHASLGFIHDIGITTIHQELNARMEYLTEQLQTISGLKILSPTDSEQRGGILTFKPDCPDPKKLHTKLMNSGVICACRGGGIRFSPHFYTPATVMDNAVKTLKKLLS